MRQRTQRIILKIVGFQGMIPKLVSELSVYALGLTRLPYFGAPEFEYKNLTSMAAQLLKWIKCNVESGQRIRKIHNIQLDKILSQGMLDTFDTKVFLVK